MLPSTAHQDFHIPGQLCLHLFSSRFLLSLRDEQTSQTCSESLERAFVDTHLLLPLYLIPLASTVLFATPTDQFRPFPTGLAPS